ncbi:hypothetical protein D3C72_1888930 [compost metagenome]
MPGGSDKPPAPASDDGGSARPSAGGSLSPESNPLEPNCSSAGISYSTTGRVNPWCTTATSNTVTASGASTVAMLRSMKPNGTPWLRRPLNMAATMPVKARV